MSEDTQHFFERFIATIDELKRTAGPPADTIQVSDEYLRMINGTWKPSPEQVRLKRLSKSVNKKGKRK